MPKQRELSKYIKDGIISEFKAYRCFSSTPNVPASTVWFIMKMWKESGTTKNMMRSGTHGKNSERNRRQMTRTVRIDPFVTRQELQTNFSRYGSNVCKRTIGNELHRQDIKSRNPRKTPLLKKTHLKSRLKFAKTHFNKEDGFFKHIIWSDECKIEFFIRNGATHVWRKNGIAWRIPSLPWNMADETLWSGVSRTLEIIDRRMDGVKFLKIIYKNQ